MGPCDPRICSYFNAGPTHSACHDVKWALCVDPPSHYASEDVFLLAWQCSLRARGPQELHARFRTTTSPEALEALSRSRLCGTAVEVASGTGAVARIIALLLECACEVVPTAHA